MPKPIGARLKEARLSMGLTVQEVSTQMIQSGFEKASVKTIYSWESGNSKPSTDYFLELCSIYKLVDILQEFEYKKTENPLEQTNELSELENLLLTLSPEKQQEIIRYMKFLAEESK